jgi:uncharacterized Zn finger protein
MATAGRIEVRRAIHIGEETMNVSKGAGKLAAAITEASLLALAGRKSYERGAAYAAAGAVTDLIEKGDAIKARVLGTEDYAVALNAESEPLAFSCTCPLGEDGVFCKHIVAAGLAWLGHGRGATPVENFTGTREFHAMRDYLATQEKEALVSLLLEQAENDPGLMSRLRAAAARRQAPNDIPALKDTVRRALAIHGFVDYHGMRRFLARAQSVADLLGGLLADGHAATALELAGYALQRGLAAYTRTDDSGGAFGDLLRRLADLHLQACRAARPDGASLAKTLFALRLNDDWDFFAFADYAPLLGEAGLQTYRTLAEKEWAKVPALGPGEENRHSANRHFTITRIMEEIAQRAGDIEALVAIKGRHLTSPYHFREIASLLAEAGRRDEALAWAERGLESFPDSPDAALAEFVAAEYQQRGRHDEALALMWKVWVDRPTLNAYQHLKTCAEKASAWSMWRDQALAWLRDDYLPARKRDRQRWSWAPGGHSLLVEIFLWEDDSDAALDEARAGGCTESLWFDLAQAREAQHPADAVAIYQKRFDAIVDQRHNDAYDRGAELVATVQSLMRRLGQREAFAAWLQAVRSKHKAKRNFMQRLDGLRDLD